MTILLRGPLILSLLLSFLLGGCTKRDRDIAPTDVRVEDAGGGWYAIYTKNGGFNALMPGQPKIQTNVVDVSGGSVNQYWLVSELSGTIAFGIFYNASARDGDRSLADACRGASRDAKVISERDIALGRARGREMVMEKMGGTARVSARVYVRENVVYVVSAVVPARKAGNESIAKFLESFTFVE